MGSIGRPVSPRRRSFRSVLGRAQVHGGFASVTTLLDVVADAVPLVGVAVARALDGADVDEDVLPAALRLDEAEALGRVIPLDDARRLLSLRSLVTAPEPSTRRSRDRVSFAGQRGTAKFVSQP
jgi:hypothetical protein